jgi:adenine-specific DNA-methyltransferase
VAADPAVARRLGVYYTPDRIARGLVRWALAGGADRLLDPSCGDGRFVKAASDELADASLGGNPLVVGIDVDEDVVAALRADAAPHTRFHARDFFSVPSASCVDGPFGAVVGNPPFIRHHWQDGDVLERARERAAEAGVTLSGLSDLWAYFVVHATQHVALDGRLGLVLPVAATQVDYAREVISFLRRSFGRLELIVLQERVFADAREQAVVLLGSGRGGTTDDVRTAVAATVDDLLTRLSARRRGGAPSDVPAGVVPWKWQLLSPEARSVWSQLGDEPGVSSLADLARVRIGTVTGANGVFVRPAEDPVFAEPGVRSVAVLSSSRHLEHAVWREKDHRVSGGQRSGGRLLVVAKDHVPTGLLGEIIDDAEADGVHERRHCESREPWYALTDLDAPDAFLGYMGASPPRLVLNAAGATCTNAVHRITWLGDDGRSAAASSWSSLFRLGAELHGRHYGGGVLKLEPAAAKRLPVVADAALADRVDTIDALTRGSQTAKARDLADRSVASALGASKTDMRLLGESAELLAGLRRVRR